MDNKMLDKTFQSDGWRFRPALWIHSKDPLPHVFSRRDTWDFIDNLGRSIFFGFGVVDTENKIFEMFYVILGLF
jgi:hypothetical protein